MSSFFKPKRSSADAKSSTKSSNVTEPDSKTQKSTSSAPTSKSPGAIHSPPPTNTGGGGGGGVTLNSKQPPPPQPKERKPSMDMQDWLETECPVDSRIMQNNTLSISRSGRFKAKGKQRTKLFSEEADGGQPQDDHPTRGSTSLSTPEDRQTVLEAMAKRTGAATPVQSPSAKQSPAGGNPLNPGANKKSSDRGTASNWSTTSNSTDL